MTEQSSLDRPQFVRIAEMGRQTVRIVVDGQPVTALQGDTVLVAVLLARGSVRVSEFGDRERAGFCLMGACQDCWMWTSTGTRVRACTTFVTDGLSVLTRDEAWLVRG